MGRGPGWILMSTCDIFALPGTPTDAGQRPQCDSPGQCAANIASDKVVELDLEVNFLGLALGRPRISYRQVLPDRGRNSECSRLETPRAKVH